MNIEIKHPVLAKMKHNLVHTMLHDLVFFTEWVLLMNLVLLLNILNCAEISYWDNRLFQYTVNLDIVYFIVLSIAVILKE